MANSHMLIRDQYTCSQVLVNADSGVWINIRAHKASDNYVIMNTQFFFVGILALAANSAARGIAKARGLLEPHVLLLLCSGGTFKCTPPQPEMTENLKILQTDGWQRGHVSLQLGAFAKMCSGYLIFIFLRVWTTSPRYRQEVQQQRQHMLFKSPSFSCHGGEVAMRSYNICF